MDPVRSPRNPRVAAAIRLRRGRERRASGLTLLEGPHLLEEAVARGAPVRQVFAAPDDVRALELAAECGGELITVIPEVLNRLAPTQHPRGPVAVLQIPPPARVTGDALLLWELTDPGNVGTLIRSAAAFGLAVVVGPGSADPWAPKVLRAAAGAHFHTTVAPDGERLAATRIVTVPRGGLAPWRLPAAARLEVVVGSEAHGLPPQLVAAADVRVTIPMPGGIESLNAAVAGSILAYEVSRLRRSNPRGAHQAPD